MKHNIPEASLLGCVGQLTTKLSLWDIEVGLLKHCPLRTLQGIVTLSNCGTFLNFLNLYVYVICFFMLVCLFVCLLAWGICVCVDMVLLLVAMCFGDGFC